MEELVNDVEIKTNEELLEDKNIELSTDDIEKFDFSSDKEFDIEKNYELIKLLKSDEGESQEKEYVKFQEAKNIIARDAKLFLDPDFVDEFTREEENLIYLIQRYDPNKEEVRKLTESEKDKIYEIAQIFFNNYQKKLNALNFNFPLDKDESVLVRDIFRKHLEYDQNEVFQLKELKENYLDLDVDNINVNDLIIFYHLFSKYKVKGITKDYYNFVSILVKIAERVKLFNAYNVIIQRISSDFQLWGGGLSVDGTPAAEALSGLVVEPKSLEENDVKLVKNQEEVVK